MENDKLVIAGHEFSSRFILGSGKYSLSLIEAAVKYAGQTIEEVNLVTAFDVKRSTLKYIGDLLLRTVRSWPFLVLLGVVLFVVLPGFIILFVVMPAKRRRRRNLLSPRHCQAST